jgi:hypothetical protein
MPRPSLLLDFSDLATFDPRLTFTRASTGTYFDRARVLRTAPANTPRISFDPRTGRCRGLLMETARTNWALRSQEFDNASWTKGDSTVTANSVAAPDGTTTADKLVEAATTAGHGIHQAASVSPAANVGWSVFANPAERNTIRLIAYDNAATSNFVSAYFDLTGDGVARDLLGAGNGIAGGATIERLPNSWYRCALWGQPNTSGSQAQGRIFLINNNLTTYLGDGTSGVHIWGAQLEAGAGVTSYIPTTSATVTRALDVCTMPVGAWYSVHEVSLFARGTRGTLPATSNIVCLSDGTVNETVQLIALNGVTNRFQVYDGGGLQAFLSDPTAMGDFEEYVMAGALAANDAAASFRGAAALTDLTATIPTVTTLDIGNFAGTLQPNGWIRRVGIIPRRVSNAELQALAA